MPTDDNDKTVFRQAPVNPDRTVIRPAPGRRQATSTASGDEPLTAPPQAASPAAATPPRHQLPDHGSAGEFVTASGLNPLVNAAAILIAVFEKTRQAVSHPDVGGLHQRLASEIRAFESNLKQQGVAPEIVLSARYCVCAALDEAVLNTPWGAESGWPQRTLLSVFHNETSGGEKFFIILERMLEYPAENIDFLELMYIFLSLGFEGKYRVVQRGRDAIEQLRDDVFASIRRQRGEYERSLSPSWQGLGKTRNSLASYVPLWVVASTLGAVLLLSYSGFRVWLYETSSPVVVELEDISAQYRRQPDGGARE